MKLYLDVCCLNWPFDDQIQDRIRLESEAVLLILAHIERGEHEWIGSDVMDLEIAQTPDAERRARIALLYDSTTFDVVTSDTQFERARILETHGFHAFDALHLACAESAQADVFLTTDDRLLRVAKRASGKLQVRAENPLAWLNEVSNP